MDDIRDDFEEKMEEDEVDALDEHDVLLGMGDEDEEYGEKHEKEEDLLDAFGLRLEDDELPPEL